jgi:molybdenum cofactor biosynthesis protein B
VAGSWQGRAVFSVPGSTAAVRLAWERLIGPELGHVAFELSRHAAAGGEGGG